MIDRVLEQFLESARVMQLNSMKGRLKGKAWEMVRLLVKPYHAIPKALCTAVLAWMLVHPSGLRPEEGWWSRRTRGPCAVGPRPTPPPPDEAKRCHVALLHRHFSTLLKNPTSTSMQLSSRGTCCVSSLG